MKTAIKNKIWAYLLTAMLILCHIVIPAYADENIITIKSVEDYYKLAAACELDTWSEGKIILLETDLEFTNGNEMTPIPYFKGTFDGQGHSISGLVISYNGSVQGLFRYIGEGASVNNLNVVGIIGPQGSRSVIGGIAGENYGTISNCTFSGVVRGNSTVGGIAGINGESGKITGCHVSGITRGNHYVGGIAGKNSGTIENCVNRGNINTSTEEVVLHLEYMNLDNLRSTENTMDITDIGGIAGFSDGRIESCTNNGRVGYQHVGYNIGGIAGRQNGYINNCVNYGSVYGRKDIGGINGQMEPYNTLIFSESTLTKLDEQFNELQARIDQLLNDTDQYSDTVTGKLSDMKHHVTGAQNSVNTMLDQIENVVNTDTDTLNELSTRISETIDKLTPASMELSDASSHMKSAIKHLREAVENVEDASSLSQEGIWYVNQAIAEMEDAQADFELAAAPLAEAGESFQTALSAFIDTLKLINEGATKEEIEEKAKQGTDALLRGMDLLAVCNRSLQSGVKNISDAMAAISSAIPYFQDAKNPLHDALNETDTSLQNIYKMSSSATEAIAGVERALQDLAEKEELSFAKLDEDFDTSRETLYDSVTEISDILAFVNSTVSSKNKQINDDIQSVSDQIFAITDTIKDALKEDSEEKEYIEDISDKDTGEQTDGKTAFCVNWGIVNGDVNVGGITGAMAIEYDFDPEDDIKTEGDSSKNFIYQTRAVIRSCTNKGSITAKKNGVGGIVGSMDLGSVIDCYAYGSVTSTDGRYTGGIAGYSGADIRHSYAKCSLSGNNYVGGIAGLGKNIRQCRSLVFIEQSDEYTGAVAGEVSGILEDNYFVSEQYHGVDGISYTTKAEPMNYNDFITLPDMPEEFFSFCLSFVADDQIIYKTQFAYGADLSNIELPRIPERDGSYGRWEDTEYSHMVFDTIVEAIYENHITALESAQKKNDLAVLLVEGRFDSDQQLHLTTKTIDSADIAENDRLLECWNLIIPEDGNTSHRVQYLVPENISSAEIEYKTTTGWQKADTYQDGKYLIWDADGTELVFRSVEKASHTLLLYITAGIATITALVAFLIYKRSNAKKQIQQPEEKEQAKNDNPLLHQ